MTTTTTTRTTATATYTYVPVRSRVAALPGTRAGAGRGVQVWLPVGVPARGVRVWLPVAVPARGVQVWPPMAVLGDGVQVQAGSAVCEGGSEDCLDDACSRWARGGQLPAPRGGAGGFRALSAAATKWSRLGYRSRASPSHSRVTPAIARTLRSPLRDSPNQTSRPPVPTSQ